MIIDTAIARYQEMKEGFVVEILDDAVAPIGYANTDTGAGYPQVSELIDDASFYVAREDAKEVAKYFLQHSNHEPVIKKAVMAVQIA